MPRLFTLRYWTLVGMVAGAKPRWACPRHCWLLGAVKLRLKKSRKKFSWWPSPDVEVFHLDRVPKTINGDYRLCVQCSFQSKLRTMKTGIISSRTALQAGDCFETQRSMNWRLKFRTRLKIFAKIRIKFFFERPVYRMHVETSSKWVIWCPGTLPDTSSVSVKTLQKLTWLAAKLVSRLRVQFRAPLCLDQQLLPLKPENFKNPRWDD